MARESKETKELWVKFAIAALGSYSIPDEVEDTEELVDDMSDVAANTADAMLDEYEERFGGGSGRRRTRRRKDDEDEEPESE